MNDVTPDALPIPGELLAAGVAAAPYQRVAALSDVPVGTMLRVTRDDLDVLIVHTDRGLVAIDDRCPHMSAPLSIGRLEDCVVHCPLHKGSFDLMTGDVVRFPTTGGLDADGTYHPTWSPPDAPAKPEPPDDKARARALTRVRRLRYYPLRITGTDIEVALPA
ncbi:MAG: Rieske 2Fe-2S domain-containing protein [Candidatus Limnocylindrales bacterium]